MKSTSAVFERLIEEARGLSTEVPESRWYVFGSVLRNPEEAEDIDVLILCSTGDDASFIRRRLRDFCLSHPVHLLLATWEEERELQFVETQGCVQLFPVSRPA
jgi:predicted nucleotidyltransferase